MVPMTFMFLDFWIRFSYICNISSTSLPSLCSNAKHTPTFRSIYDKTDRSGRYSATWFRGGSWKKTSDKVNCFDCWKTYWHKNLVKTNWILRKWHTLTVSSNFMQFPSSISAPVRATRSTYVEALHGHVQIPKAIMWCSLPWHSNCILQGSSWAGCTPGLSPWTTPRTTTCLQPSSWVSSPPWMQASWEQHNLQTHGAWKLFGSYVEWAAFRHVVHYTWTTRSDGDNHRNQTGFVFRWCFLQLLVCGSAQRGEGRAHRVWYVDGGSLGRSTQPLYGWKSRRGQRDPGWDSMGGWPGTFLPAPRSRAIGS